MNRFFLLIAFLCTIVISSSIVTAQTTTPSNQAEPANTSNQPVTRRPFTAEPSLPKIAQTRLLNLAANMSNRMDSAVARLQNVINRLNSRLEKMAAAGVNVSAAKTELALAQTKLDEAKRNLENIDTEVNAFVGSATPRENWKNLKNTYFLTRAAIVASHQSILASINLAQNTTVSVTPTASSSATSTNN